MTRYLPDISFQPIAVDDVAAILASVATSGPANGTIAIAGPEKDRMATIIERYLKNTGDMRPVLPDPNAGYFGVDVDDQSLVPLEGDKLIRGKISLQNWFSQHETV